MAGYPSKIGGIQCYGRSCHACVPDHDSRFQHINRTQSAKGMSQRGDEGVYTMLKAVRTGPSFGAHTTVQYNWRGSNRYTREQVSRLAASTLSRCLSTGSEIETQAEMDRKLHACACKRVPSECFTLTAHFDDMTSVSVSVTRSVCKLHEEVRRAFFGEALRGSQPISFRPRDD